MSAVRLCEQQGVHSDAAHPAAVTLMAVFGANVCLWEHAASHIPASLTSLSTAERARRGGGTAGLRVNGRPAEEHR